MDMTIGKRVAQLRRAKGLTQEELASRLGVSPQAVSKWENDQTCPDISLLLPLSRLLGVTTDELLSGSQESATVQMLPPEQRKDFSVMMLRIVADSSDGDKVRVNLPLALVEVCLEMGMEMPQINGNDALKGIDLKKILDLAHQGVIGNLVEAESSDGDTVRIFVE